ncbi:facilitated trehalose transporter Tret1-like [Diorhabda sublineata]|uniref:facilitated trehalose transporter Tret1-like n=1 Tax=Diorhabda sublineata TaxID=1163346 RepID=UPI0024E0C525|nr:facilitated trehalose transporter Tret1-like [Diorhabda sublineata]
MLEKTKIFLHSAAFCVNILTFTTGIAMSWSSPSLPKLSSTDPDINPLGEPITTSQESWIASLPSIASVFGTIIAGLVADRIGRKKTLLFFSISFLVCYIVIAFAKSVTTLYITRFLIGISCGSTLAVLPSYVAEISEDSNRGVLGCIMGIMGSSGYLFVYAIGPFVSIRTFAFLQVVPILIFYLIFVPFIPESPYHFLANDLRKEAEDCLRKIRKPGEVERELAYLIDVVKENKSKNWRDIYSTKAARKGLIITCGLLAFQQLLGFMAVLSYMQTIFEATGTSIPSNTASIIIGVVQIISNVLATILVDKLGRKKLLLTSNIGCTLSLTCIGTFFFFNQNEYDTDTIFWLPLLSLVIFFVSFNFGYGTLPLTICGELFQNNIKSLAASLSTFVCLSLSFLVTLCFPYLENALNMTGVFAIFAVASVFSISFVVFVVPETKGKSFKEILDILGD